MATTSPDKVKALCVATRCTTVDEFVATFHRFCDDESFFVATLTMRQVGLETPFAIQLSDRTPVLRGLCVVKEAWSSPLSPFGRPGIQLKIIRLTRDSTEVFTKLRAARRSTQTPPIGSPIVAPPAIPPPARPPPATAEPAPTSPKPAMSPLAFAKPAVVATIPSIPTIQPRNRKRGSPGASDHDTETDLPTVGAVANEPTSEGIPTAIARPPGSPVRGVPIGLTQPYGHRVIQTTPSTGSADVPAANQGSTPAAAASGAAAPTPARDNPATTPLAPASPGAAAATTPARAPNTPPVAVPITGGPAAAPKVAARAQGTPASTPALGSRSTDAAGSRSGSLAMPSQGADASASPRLARGLLPASAADAFGSTKGTPARGAGAATAPHAGDRPGLDEVHDERAAADVIARPSAPASEAFVMIVNSPPVEPKAPVPPALADRPPDFPPTDLPEHGTTGVTRRSSATAAALARAGEPLATDDGIGVPRTLTGSATLDPAARVPGSDYVLPANPLMNLTDESLEGFVDCTLYEAAAIFVADELTPPPGVPPSRAPSVMLPAIEPPLAAPSGGPASSPTMSPESGSELTYDPIAYGRAATGQLDPAGWADPASSAQAPLDPAHARVTPSQLPPSPVDPSDGHPRAVAAVAGVAAPVRRQREPRRLWIALVAAALAVVAVALLVVSQRTRSTEPAAAGDRPDTAPPPAQRVAAADSRVVGDPPAAPAPIAAEPPPVARADAAPAVADPEPSETPPAAGEAPVVGKGPCRVTIAATPAGAQVQVDGDVVGPAPLAFDGPCQRRRIELSHPRYATTTKFVTPTEGKAEALDITLPRPTHSLTVVTQPANATVSIDGRRAGTTPTVVQIMGFQSMSVTVEKPGYRTTTKRVYSRQLKDQITITMTSSLFMPKRMK